MTRPAWHERLRTKESAFTLVEILIVVVILGILAAIVVPQFTHAADLSRENAIRMDLFRIRTQLEMYKQQHNGMPPVLTEFARQMTEATDVNGDVPPGGGRTFGPYLSAIPKNPETQGADPHNVTADPPAPDKAWYYNEVSGDFRANHSDVARLW